MNKEDIIQLTSSLYQATLLFPKKEPLRYKAREVADDLLADLISLNLTNGSLRKNEKRISILENLEVLAGFFELIRNQNWLSEESVLSLSQKYDSIKVELAVIEKEDILTGQPLEAKAPEEEIEIPVRQKKILEFLKEKEKAQVWELNKIFPSVTKRTLRRDFAHLLKKGFIERKGEKNETYYRLKQDANIENLFIVA